MFASSRRASEYPGLYLQGVLEVSLGGSRITLALSDKSEIEEAGGVVWIESKPLRKYFFASSKRPKISIGEAKKGIGASRSLNFEQRVELLDCFLGLSGHEVAFTERRKQIRTTRSDLEIRIREVGSHPRSSFATS